MKKNKTLITISHYNKRNKLNLTNLLKSLKNQNSDLLIVMNDDVSSFEKNDIFQNIKTLIRPNTGMNIGSWNSSYLNNKNYDFYIFVQDEFKILNIDFVNKYVS